MGQPLFRAAGRLRRHRSVIFTLRAPDSSRRESRRGSCGAPRRLINPTLSRPRVGVGTDSKVSCPLTHIIRRWNRRSLEQQGRFGRRDNRKTILEVPSRGPFQACIDRAIRLNYGRESTWRPDLRHRTHQAIPAADGTAVLLSSRVALADATTEKLS